jgi:DNA polymerase elongation subunit (family B)
LNRSVVALDIETAGLMPERDRIVSVGLWDYEGAWWIHEEEEKDMLALLSHWAGRPFVTWNGDEFDMPFIYARSRVLGYELRQFDIMPLGRQRGKYDGQLYRTTWFGKPVIDIAPWYREAAERHGVKWSLEPVAGLMGVRTFPVDEQEVRFGVQDMHPERLRLYNLGHARATYELYQIGGWK